MSRKTRPAAAALLAVTAMTLGLLVLTTTPASAAGTTYYVSASSGSDSNSGLSASTPWQTLTKASSVVLSPGDEILLKAGDTWTGQTLTPQGSGTPTNPIVISSYGTGARPHISPGIGVKDYAIHLVEVDGYDINGLEISNTYGGVVTYYDGTYGHEYLTVENCDFHDITGKDTEFSITPSNTDPSGAPLPDLYFGTGISFGFNGNGNTMLSDVTLTNNTFERDDAGIDEVSNGPVTRTYMENVTVTDNSFDQMYRTGGVMIYTTTDGTVSNNTFDEAGGYIAGMFWGNAAVQITASADVAVSDNDIGQTSRAGDTGDGEGVDFESYDLNDSITGNYIHDCLGPALLIYGGNGYWGLGNSGSTISGNRLDYNDTTLEDGNTTYFIPSGTSNTGTVSNNIVTLQNNAQSSSFSPLTNGGGNIVNTRDGNDFILGPSYDDTVTGSGSDEFAYTSGWTACSSCSQANGFYDGTAHYSNTTGASTTFTFVGTQAQLFGVRGPDEGIASVSIDGGTAIDVDAYTPIRTEDVPLFTSTLLPSGTHTLTITVTGTKNASATNDYLTVDRAVIGSQIIGFNIDDSQTGTGTNQINFSSGWTTTSGYGDANGFFGNTSSYSQTAGDTVRLTFNGTQVQLFGVVGPDEGKATVSVDSGSPVTIDDYAATRVEDIPIFLSSTLAMGTHSVVLTVSGTSNPLSSGDYVSIDRAISGYSLTGTTIDDSVTGTGANTFAYSSGWTACTSCSQANDDYDGTLHYSATSGDTTTYTFTGTRGVIYGVQGPDEGIATFSVDGGTPVSVDAYTPQRVEEVPLFVTGVLTSGTHTIKLAVTGTHDASSTAAYIGVDAATGA